MISMVRVRSRCKLLFFFLLPIVVMVAPLEFVGRECLAIHTKSHRKKQPLKVENSSFMLSAVLADVSI
ncbi:hypothetical protein G4B88_006408 [Cannabis sativa]|uniref:Uncharacterized protein n=1 Tax=Cannabis sativa TaxID=3483 RepID=A0A7J6H4G8_CANSA|nr:hypothetical protein G4B88_006408 [Cannabis sativa]